MGSSFDSQAATYDQRAGLPAGVDRAVAQAVLELAEVQPGDVVVEVGVGTGQIGQWFAHESVHYVGYDLSPGMLHRFQRRLDRWGETCILLAADGNQDWPFRDATARVIFSSRSIHLLHLEHVVAETLRVAHPRGSLFLVGRVQRPATSLQTQMQHQLQHLLRHYGLPAGGGEQYQQRLLAYCCQCGAEALLPVVVAQWRVASTPGDAIAAWRDKPGLSGLDPPAALKHAILTDLASWAEATFGGLERQVESDVAYALQGVRLRYTAQRQSPTCVSSHVPLESDGLH
jgi:ubiquinone/menaquinone biosynthesis C-methylase UbiE